MSIKSFAHWFQNSFWYHYKWHAVAGLCVTLFAVSFIVSLIGRERPDFSYLFAIEDQPGPAPLEAWNEFAEQRLSDSNGDGKVIVRGVGLGFNDSPAGIANRITFTALMTDDETLLMVLDESALAGFEGQADVFLPLSELGLPSEPGRPWLLRVEPPVLYRRLGIERNFYLCVKALTPEKRARSGTQTLYEQAAEFGRMLLEMS